MKSLQIPCDGYSLAADWYDGSNDEILLVIPGWSSNKKRYEDLVGAIAEQSGTAALVVDLSGHGESPFELAERTPAQNLAEVVAAYDWLKENYPNKTINVMGTSYGGYLAAWLTTHRKVNKLVLRAPAIYKPEDMNKQWKNIDREDTRAKYRKNTKLLASNQLFSEAAGFGGKALVVVHEFDEEIPKATSAAFIKAFNSDEYIAKGFKHSFGAQLGQRDKIVAYQKVISDWLNKN
jgi:hypothetical protein